MRIEHLEWDKDNLEHIARHDVEDYEVEEVCFGRPKFRRGRKQTIRTYGQTEDGRYLFIVLVRRGDENEYRAITARDMTKSERRLFQRMK